LPLSTGPFIQWEDLFVLVDDGTIPSAGYGPIESEIREQNKTFPRGVGLLCILPPDAKPPPDEVKRTVKVALARVASSLSSVAYVIEGTGFKGVAVRAALVGMKIFSSRPYPIYVESSLRQAVDKMLSHMVNGSTASVDAIVKAIGDARLRWKMPAQARTSDERHLK
jgi:hypothetical protein